MTATRIARAGRSRFIIGLVILVLTVGFVAIFHSSQQQLDELRQVGLRCEQQQEYLATQMQIVVDHKFKLEKSLAAEKTQHEQTRQELQQKAREEKELRDKTSMESNLRLASLQQHYKLLKSENDDLTDECSKAKQKQLIEINGLQGKLTNLQTQLAQAERLKLNEIDNWKAKYKQLESEKLNLEATLTDNEQQELNKKPDIEIKQLKYKNYKLEKQIDEYKAHCSYNPDIDNNNNKPQQIENPSMQDEKLNEVRKNFKGQIAISEDLYKIPIIKIFNNKTKILLTTTSAGLISGISNNYNNSRILLSSATVLPIGISSSSTSTTTATTTNRMLMINNDNNNFIPNNLINKNNNNYNNNNKLIGQNGGGGIINSVENFQILPKPLADNSDNVLQQPPNIKSSTASSSTSTAHNNKIKKTSETNLNNKKMNKDVKQPLPIPGPLSTDNIKKVINHEHSIGNKLKLKAVPNGVVNVPKNDFENDFIDEKHNDNSDVKMQKQQQQEPNRYSHIIDTVDGKKDLNNDFDNGDNANENENGAHEVNDNDFNIIDDKNHKDHLQQVLDDEKINININNNNNNNNQNLNNVGNNNNNNGNNIINNAAEEDTNLYDNKLTFNLQKPNDVDLDLDIINKHISSNNNDKKHKNIISNNNNQSNNNKYLKNNEKLLNEIAGDQGKVADYPEDIHLEEQVEEDDDDEYANLVARDQGAAVRN